MNGGWRRAREVATGAAAAILVFAAVPSVLVALAGFPLPRGSGGVVSWQGLFDLLAVVAWCAWAVCVWPLLCSVIARVRARDAAPRGGARLVDQLALRIAAGVLAVSPVVVTTHSASAGASTRLVPIVAASAPAPSTATSPRPPASDISGVSSPDPVPIEGASTYTVSTGESLWTIAESCYGDGAAWQAIAGANLGQVMDDGTRFVDPSVIRPGWVLTIPALTDGSVPAPALSAVDNVSTAVDAPPPEPTRLTMVSRRRRGSPRTRTLAPRRRTASATSPPNGSGAPVPVPALAMLGCGALVAALLARRARRARKLAAFVRREGLTPAPPTPTGADLAVAVDRFERVPVAEWVELAARHLDWALSSRVDDGSAPRVVVMRAGPDGVEVRLSQEPGTPPSGWLAHGASSWLLPSSSDAMALARTASSHEPWSPVLLPVGDDGSGTWLLPLDAGSVVHVLGPAAVSLVRAMYASAQSWTWHEHLVITNDADVALRATESTVRRADGTLRAHVLFVGDPSELPAPALARCAVLSQQPAGTEGVTVVVDHKAATLHPLGITVRPHLLRASWAAAVSELDGEATGCAPAPRAAVVPLRHREREGGATITLRPAEPAPAARIPVAANASANAKADDNSDADPDAAAAIEVRLLTAVPRIDGLRQPIDPKRARRAIEVIAYLAVHHPEPVTGDRLRTRVLGSADVDAAAKTLFNTAGAARRALGLDQGGSPLLPSASRSGQYRLSPLVSLDIQRLADLVTAGLAASEAAEAATLLAAALRLVEGEPLSGVLTGYGWWRGEGHERRTADLVVDGACRLVRESVATGHLDLARWALDRARQVEPYSEPLTRAAMEAAAAAGDLRRLHLEWRECQRQADELDPGGMPSQATERLYVRLRNDLAARDNHQSQAAAPMMAGGGGAPSY